MTDAFILFFSLLAVLFALLVLTIKQPIRCALALIGHMISLAGVYAALGAYVIAMFQILIYVGAVMVFMVYTIMLLDDRDISFLRPYGNHVFACLITGIGVAGALLAAIVRVVPATAPLSSSGESFLTFGVFSQAFMERYWFHFELATILLMIGIVAAWTIIKESARHE